MRWTDNGIILSVQKHADNNGIVTVLTSERGLYRGYARNIKGKNCGVYQPGNAVSASWNARLTEQLGNFSLELVQPNAAILINEFYKLAALSSICSILEKTLAEREPHCTIFGYLAGFIDHLKYDDGWEVLYILFEMELLKELGFGLDLNCCAATGTKENLIYVSPKSGRAVCASAGKPYHTKLLKLPAFIHKPEKVKINTEEINNGLALSSYFLNKYIFEPHKRKIPAARAHLVQLINASTRYHGS